MSVSTISYSSESIDLGPIGSRDAHGNRIVSREIVSHHQQVGDKRKRKISKKLKMADRGRKCCVGLSTVIAIFSLILLTVCMFSASFRYNSDSLGGMKNYGLFRFCYTPETQTQSRDDDSNSKTCHLRNYINSAYCQEKSNTNHDKSTRNCFGDFELATIILISASMACCILSICFSICTIFIRLFGALAQSVVLIAAAICSLSGFLSYTYYYELKDNQYELVSGYQYQIHYGWAYYVFGFASLLQWIAFVCSLFGSAFVLVAENKKRQSKVTSTAM
ncbi:hypothetical protein B9Z55_013947 [Caenorhabditis nigoni]|uniref:Uncharacterized protein n=1 Tax=Caenorhabditis nigoni TaxID=1611254 RepID=A0A2G5U3Y0_9PELO|nr:hypothetical protein B9Z55_013947 [Caenorhabditis nigoni]